MKVHINQEPHSLDQKKTLKELLSDLGYGHDDGIALAINDEVVPRKNWENRELANEDHITLIHATQGG